MFNSLVIDDMKTTILDLTQPQARNHYQKKYHHDFDRYIDEKIRVMSKQVRWAMIANRTINFFQIFFNILVLLLVALAIWWAIAIKTQHYGIFSFLSNYSNSLSNEGFIYVIVLGTATFLLFCLSVFISIYKTTMKWSEYRKVMSELQYLYLYYDNRLYSKEQLDQDLQSIKDKYLSKQVKISWKTILKKQLKEGKHVK